jgi:hypothetical protein
MFRFDLSYCQKDVWGESKIAIHVLTGLGLPSKLFTMPHQKTPEDNRLTAVNVKEIGKAPDNH